jgi:serine protease Do
MDSLDRNSPGRRAGRAIRRGGIFMAALALSAGLGAAVGIRSQAATEASSAVGARADFNDRSGTKRAEEAKPAFPVGRPSVRATPVAPGSFADLAEQVAPSVVNITVSKTLQGTAFQFPTPFGGPQRGPFDDFFRRFQVPDAPQRQKGLGSGVIISQDGFILTNNHVVADADVITVRLSDKREFKGKVVGRDPKTDLALIKVTGDAPLPFAALGDSSTARVGDWVVAVGNPFGLDHTVTAGIISAKGRALEGPYDDFIQTDASINPGNSGGPLLNLRGEVIGINAQIVAGGQGIGFAIPSNLARQIATQLKTSGIVSRGWLGVAIQDLSPEMASHFDLKGKDGALVADVTRGGPAEKAGLRRGDVIVSFDGKAIHESHDLPLLVAGTPIGKKVELKVLRNGKTDKIDVLVGQLEEERTAKAGQIPGDDHPLGLAVQDLTPEIAQGLGRSGTAGVLVTEVAPGSPADDAGLRRGDVIREVNQHATLNSREFVAAVRGAKKTDSVLFLVEREGSSVFIAVDVNSKRAG